MDGWVTHPKLHNDHELSGVFLRTEKTPTAVDAELIVTEISIKNYATHNNVGRRRFNRRPAMSRATASSLCPRKWLLIDRFHDHNHIRLGR
jgi:hypothetical protein